jgi:branched-chain amino acid transport system substrate-binding protein
VKFELKRLRRATLLALSLLFLSCQIPNSGTVEPSVIQLGVAMPMTGSLSARGPSRRKAAELAMEHLNEVGGIDGKKIQLFHVDSATNGPIAAQRVREMFAQHPDIQALIGPSGSQESREVLTVMKEKQRPMISPASTSAIFSNTDDNGYFFRTVPSDAFQGQILAAKIRDFGFTKVATLYVDNAYGQSLNQVLKTDLETHQGQVIAEVKYPEAVKVSYDEEIKQLLSQPVEAVCFIGYPGEAPAIFNAWLKSGLAPELKWFFSDGLKAAEIVQGVSQPEKLDTSIGSIPAASSQQGDSLFFQDAYIQRYGDFPVSFAANTYDALILASLAIQRTRFSSTKDLREAIREVASPPGTVIRPGKENLKEALRLLAKGEDIDYQGVSGDLNMDAVGDVRNDYEIWTLKNGFIFRVETFSIAGLEIPKARRFS